MAELLSFPFAEIARLIVGALPAMLLSPTHALFLWLIIFFVSYQYRRMADTEQTLYGRTRITVWRSTLEAAAHGLFGGLVASFLLVFVGVSIGERDILYLWPVALLLMLFHPRFICFSYGATLIGVSHLLTGWPDVNVAGIVGLVAILHVVEGILVALGGDDGAIPFYVRHRRAPVVGAFSVQRFWPVPLVVLLALSLPPGLQVETVAMPDWWPLVTAPSSLESESSTGLVLWPVAAALGYSDLAVSSEPRARSRQAAGLLLLYSGVLLGLAIAGSRWPSLLWVAVVASGGLHELMIQAGVKLELGGEPRFIAPRRGVLVMDVFPDGYAHSLGLQRGDIITAINGRPVHNKDDFRLLLQQVQFYLELEVIRQGARITIETNRYSGHPAGLDLVLAPEPYDQPQVQLLSYGIVQRWLRRLVSFGRSRP